MSDEHAEEREGVVVPGSYTRSWSRVKPGQTDTHISSNWPWFHNKVMDELAFQEMVMASQCIAAESISKHRFQYLHNSEPPVLPGDADVQCWPCAYMNRPCQELTVK